MATQSNFQAILEKVVDVITACLADFVPDQYEFNAFVVSYLLDLDAKESAETIERAFAADCIDMWICGDWHDVRAELGVDGIGLVPERPAAQSQAKSGWPASFEFPGFMDAGSRGIKPMNKPRQKKKKKSNPRVNPEVESNRSKAKKNKKKKKR